MLRIVHVQSLPVSTYIPYLKQVPQPRVRTHAVAQIGHNLHEPQRDDNEDHGVWMLIDETANFGKYNYHAKEYRNKAQH